MSKNIKDISKKLLGQSLNSFHRKTGLTQLEKNNEMQDGVLNGILSQVDNAYIEKTEQSNVIHLDGSGDGVVVVDSIEGNTMVNIHKKQVPSFVVGGADTNNYNITSNPNYIKITLNDGLIFSYRYIAMGNLNIDMFKPNTTYTLVFSKIKGVNQIYFMDGNATNKIVDYSIQAIDNKLVYKFTTNSSFVKSYQVLYLGLNTGVTTLDTEVENPMIFEGDYTDKFNSQQYFEGMKSCFEEQVEDDKYKIEILSNNENLFDFNKENYNLLNTTWSVESDHIKLTGSTNNYPHICGKTPIRLKPNTDYTFFIDGYGTGNYTRINIGTEAHEDKRDLGSTFLHSSRSISICYFRTDNTGLVYIHMYLSTPQDTVPTNFIYSCGVVQGVKNITQIKKQKQNKIKLLINEPLRSVGDVKDRLCFKDGKLVVERNIIQKHYDGTKNVFEPGGVSTDDLLAIDLNDLRNVCRNNYSQKDIVCDIFANKMEGVSIDHIYKYCNTGVTVPVILINKSKLSSLTVSGFIDWVKNNPFKVACALEVSTYEEVTNEYGEPIILEGYENGTLYIDSAIIPTTSVRYTPNMKSINTLKEVSNNNIMLTTDINDTIIPYMMEVDLMIMEKEMSLFNSLNKNIRKMEVLDMTSMQKRTGEMLERLIKGKTLNEQECKTRVTVYLNAGKITDEQAEELMLLISEIYA